MSTTHVDAETTNSLFDQLGDWSPEGITAIEQERQEWDVRDAKRLDLHYQRRIEAGHRLTADDLDEWQAAQDIVCAAIAWTW